MATLWRERWLASSQNDIPVVERLQDAERPGAPAKFSLEQILQLFALACEQPETYGRPISHWTPRELALEVVKQGIVETISPMRLVGAITRGSHPQTAPVRVLVEPPPTLRSTTKSTTSAKLTSMQNSGPKLGNERSASTK